MLHLPWNVSTEGLLLFSYLLYQLHSRYLNVLFSFVEEIDPTANLESNATPEPVRAPPLDDTVQEIPALLINGQGDVVQSNQPEPPQPQINYGEKLVSKIANSREIEDPTCAICLIDYDFKDRMSIMSLQSPSKVSQLKCGHWFHYQCIKEWFQHKNANECPVCRGIAVWIWIKSTRKNSCFFY